MSIRSYFILSTFHLVASQPNGGGSENCLTSFIPYNGNSPKWYDRPCFENDAIGEKGHKFMCEVEEFPGKEKYFSHSNGTRPKLYFFWIFLVFSGGN